LEQVENEATKKKENTPRELEAIRILSLWRFTPECSHLLDSCEQRLSRRRVPGVKNTPHDVQFSMLFRVCANKPRLASSLEFSCFHARSRGSDFLSELFLLLNEPSEYNLSVL
jgi:hypothetical protein